MDSTRYDSDEFLGDKMSLKTRLISDLLDTLKAASELPSHKELLRRHSLRSSMAVSAESPYLYPPIKSRFASKPHYRLCVHGLRVYYLYS